MYDPEADALVIRARGGKPAYGRELAGRIIVHFDERGEPVEIELLDATELLAKLAEAVESAKAGRANRQRAHQAHPSARPGATRVSGTEARAAVGLESLLQVDLRKLLGKIGEARGAKLPEKVVEAHLDAERDLLFVRFREPEGVEVAEPLPTKTPTFLFTDERTGEVTALEVVGASELLKELEGPRAELPSNRELVAMIMYLAGGRVRGSARLQKTVFLVQRRLGLGSLRFEPWKYGPWSRELEELLRELEGRGLLKVRAETPDLASEFFKEAPSRVYEASRELIEEGERAYARLAKAEPLKALQLKRLVAAALAAPLSYLVAYIYAKYPEMTARSSIHDKVREWMRFYGLR